MTCEFRFNPQLFKNCLIFIVVFRVVGLWWPWVWTGFSSSNWSTVGFLITPPGRCSALTNFVRYHKREPGLFGYGTYHHLISVRAVCLCVNDAKSTIAIVKRATTAVAAFSSMVGGVGESALDCSGWTSQWCHTMLDLWLQKVGQRIKPVSGKSLLLPQISFVIRAVSCVLLINKHCSQAVIQDKERNPQHYHTRTHTFSHTHMHTVDRMCWWQPPASTAFPPSSFKLCRVCRDQ